MSKTTVRAGLSAGRPHKVLTMTGVMAAILAMHTPVCAGADATLPIISAIQAGSVSHSVNEAGTVMNIVQTTQRAVVNYDSFNIGRQATVNHTGGLLLGRVTGGTASRIDGTLNTSGLVLVNPNGIAIGSTANINAGSFTASTFNISNDDFMAGRLRFERSGTETGVLNEGAINTKGGGYVVLVGASVDNHGRIATAGGDVVLASGQTATISVPLSASGRVRLELDAGALNAAVANHAHGVIVTHGGHVLMRAAAVVDAASAGRTAPATVTHMGQIDTTGDQGGRVDVLADHGMVRVGGSITANSTGTHTDGSTRAGGDIYIGRDEETHVLAAVGDSSGATLESKAGFVETSGQFLATYGTRVMAKDWLLDPTNITIAASGASGTAYNSQFSAATNSVVLASDIMASLNAGTSVTLATSISGSDAGNILVNTSITKTAGTDATLTLRAHNDIVVNSGVQITSTSGKLNVVFNSDFDGSGAGAIIMQTGSSIQSLGGHITLGGGTEGNGSGFARGYNSDTRTTGISLVGVILNAAGGNIGIKGQGSSTAVSNNRSVGVDIASASQILTSSAGTVTLHGVGGEGSLTTNVGVGIRAGSSLQAGSGGLHITGQAGNGSEFNIGVWFSDSGTSVTSAGHVHISGTGGNISSSNNLNDGVAIQHGASLSATGTANVTISGVANFGNGVRLNNGGAVSSQSGNITIDGQSALSTTFDVRLQANSNPGSISSTHGNVVVNADSLSIEGTSSISASAGRVTLANRSTGTVFNLGGADITTGASRSLGLTTSELGRITAQHLTLGSATAGQITVSADITTSVGNGHLSLVSGGNISIAAVLNVGGRNLTLEGAGSNSTITQTQAITAAGLALLGTNATHTLSHSSNAFSTLAANTKNLTAFTPNALAVGTVNTTNGIVASGSIHLSSNAQLSVNQAVSTTYAADNAMVLVAGQATAAGTSTGGDVVIGSGGSLSVGSGGRATVYTGSISGSTGLTIAAGHSRFNSSISTTNFSTALGIGLHVVYREARTITGTASPVTKTYDGQAYRTTALTWSGFVNNDSATQLSSLNFTGNAEGAVNAGTYTISAAASNGLGYSINTQGSSLVISPAPLTITVNDSSVFATQLASSAPDMGVRYSGFVNGETAAVLTGAAVRRYNGETSYLSAGTRDDVFDLSQTPTSENYQISVVRGDLHVIPAYKLLITIQSQSADYGSQTASNIGAAALGTVSAQYCFVQNNCNGSNLVDLVTSQLTPTRWKALDNTGSFVVFDTAVSTPSYSTGGYLKAGNYIYSASEIAPMSLFTNGVANFTGRAVNAGVLTINARELRITAANEEQLFTGSQLTQSLGMQGLLDGDDVGVTGLAQGTTNGSYMSNLVVGGTDRANYRLVVANGTLRIVGQQQRPNRPSRVDPQSPGRPLLPTDISQGSSQASASLNIGSNPFELAGSNPSDLTDPKCNMEDLSSCRCDSMQPADGKRASVEMENTQVCYEPLFTSVTSNPGRPRP